jgi:hypothetical protein
VFDQRFKSTEDFLHQWSQQADTLGEPPSSEDVQNILYSLTRGTCVHWLINGVCQLLLDRPYRDNSTKQVPLALKQELRDKFNKRFKVGGETSWGEFSVAWVEQLDDSDPPRHQTIRGFLESEHRSSCEHWLVNGLCQLLLNCSFDQWLEQCQQIEGNTGETPVLREYRRDGCCTGTQARRLFYKTGEEDAGSLSKNSMSSQSSITNPQPKIQNPKSKIQNPKSIDDGATRWVGRAELISQLSCRLQEDCRVLSLVGITGIGKTALAMRLVLESDVGLWRVCKSGDPPQPPLKRGENSVKVPLFKGDLGGSESDRVVCRHALGSRELYTISLDRELPNFEMLARRLLGEQTATDEQLQKEPDLLVRAMVAKLRSHPCFLVLDMVEEILEPDGQGEHQFIEPGFAKLLEQVVKAEQCKSRIILTSQDRPPIIAEGRYCDRSHMERLKGLEESEALELFENWDVRIQTDVDLENIKRIIHVYEGHPLALRVIAGEIREPPYNGDVQVYWYEYGYEIEEAERLKDNPMGNSREDKPRLDRYSIGLADLVKKRVDRTFTRLYQSDRLACLMLCQGAVYRRAVERQAWLLMVCEYPYEAQILAFQTLQRRFLLEEECCDRKVLYRLHSLIRRVAIDYLPKIEEEVLPL